MLRRVIYTAALAVAFSFGIAGAQDVGASSLNPVPLSDVPPPSEVLGGSAGNMDTASRANHTHPRITRAMTVTTASDGTFSGTWSVPLAAAPNISLVPIAPNTSIDCQLTAAPTASTFQGRCFSAQTTLLNLSIVTAGLTLNPVTNTGAGVSVQVIAVPATQ